MERTEGFIEVTGGKVWYQKFDNNTGKTPVLILHGGPGSSHFVLQGLKMLAKDRPVIFYDQLGCGKSDRPTDESLWTLERFSDELSQVRKALKLDKVHILGHSWGTTLAAANYFADPEGIKSIIFSSSCLSAPLWAEDQARNRLKLPQEVQAVLLRCEAEGRTDSQEYHDATIEFNKRFVCRLNPLPEIFKEGAQYKNPVVYNIMWGPSEFHVTGNLKEVDFTARLGEITVPVLYTCGRYDEATPESTAYFSSLTPGSKYHVFENSAHLPYLEDREEYIEVIGGFLKEQD